jgi:hypothetical protein
MQATGAAGVEGMASPLHGTNRTERLIQIRPATPRADPAGMSADQPDEGDEAVKGGLAVKGESRHHLNPRPTTKASSSPDPSNPIPTDPQQPQSYCGNSVYTTKYNAWTFLPKFLGHQFSQAGNLFVLFISVLQQVPGVSPMNRFSTAAPLLFIIVVSAIKELVEDKVFADGCDRHAKGCLEATGGG